eukprot:scaffold15084_cov76-Skeletonema_marinoi.AAC.2
MCAWGVTKNGGSAQKDHLARTTEHWAGSCARVPDVVMSVLCVHAKSKEELSKNLGRFWEIGAR